MSNVDLKKLKEIVEATASGANAYVSFDVGQPMAAAGLIEVNTDVVNPTNPSEALCRSTQAGADYLKANEGKAEADTSAGKYTVMTGIALPPAKKRGNTAGSGAPTKYPFAELPLNGVFFSANSEHKKGDAVKALGSTVSAQNEKYSEQVVKDGVPQTKTIERAVRDKQTKKAKLGPDGKKVMETVTLPVKKYNRKFTIRPVAKGYQSGSWTAPEDGALIARII